MSGASSLGSMDSCPRTEERVRQDKEAIKVARAAKTPKDGICSGCGKRGRKALPGIVVQKFHAIECGKRHLRVGLVALVEWLGSLSATLKNVGITSNKAL